MRYWYRNLFVLFTSALCVPSFVFANPIVSGFTDASFVDTAYGDVRMVIAGSDTALAGTAPVDVTATSVDGYAFGDDVGWISFQGLNYGVDVTCVDGIGTLSNYGWGQNTGFINFGPFNNSATQQVEIDANGDFSGYAWANNQGWLDFSGVRTTFSCDSGGSSGGGGDPAASCTLSAAPGAIAPGQSTTLIWSANFPSNSFTSGLISPTIGTISAASGSTTVAPSSTTTYTATVNTSSSDFSPQTATCSTTVTVDTNYSAIGFDPTVYTVQEGGIAQLKLVRAGSSLNAIDALVSTVAGSANAGSDYTAVLNYPVHWNAGDTSIKTVPVSVLTDSAVENTEQFLGTITFASTAITNQTAIVNIHDQNQLPQSLTTVVLKKVVQNNYGGTLGPSDFTIRLNNQTVSQNSPITVQPNTQYVITEDTVSDYIFDSITGAGCPAALGQPFSVADGATVVCTVHNNDICTGPSCLEPQNECLDPSAENYHGTLPCTYAQGGDGDSEDNGGITCTEGSCDGTNKKIIEGVSIAALLLGLLNVLRALTSGIGTINEFAARLLGLFVPIRRKPWGVVYDSVTKDPLDPVVVTVFDVDGNEIAQTTTDMHGRYGFLLKAGTYTMTAAKTHYVFPTRFVKGKADSGYDPLYFGGEFTINEETTTLLFNIPMDPIARDWNQDEKERMKIFHRQQIISWIDKITKILFPIGLIVSIIAVYQYPFWYNFAVLGLYAVNVFMIIRGVEPKSYGSVLDTMGKPITGARVTVFQLETKIMVARRVTNEFGQYYMLVQPGHYYYTVEELLPDGTYKLSETSEPFELHRGIFNKVVKLLTTN